MPVLEPVTRARSPFRSSSIVPPMRCRLKSFQERSCARQGRTASTASATPPFAQGRSEELGHRLELGQQPARLGRETAGRLFQAMADMFLDQDLAGIGDRALDRLQL